VTQVRGAGLPVELQINGTPGVVSAAVDAAAFRVIQEALTNALKHAARARTSVSVQYEPGAVALEVRSGTTTGSGSGSDGEGGHGLVGMRERVELYGGELHAGPVAAGGYVVRARLPLEGDGK
jgi:signal transduction histidine kinase